MKLITTEQDDRVSGVVAIAPEDQEESDEQAEAEQNEQAD